MIAFLVASFFSVLSNCICVFFVKNGYIVLEKGQIIMDIFLHVNIINMFLFTLLFTVQKARNKVPFRVVDTFRGKQNIIQFLLFIFPVIAAIFKTFMLDFVPVTTITISSLITPFTVWALAIVLLKERFNPAYIKYSLLAVIGFTLVNMQKLSGGGWSFGFLHYLIFYIFLESIGQITLRYYCRKREYEIQAVMAEIVIFFIYGSTFLVSRGNFSLSLMLNPFVWIVAICCFMRHLLLINGVRRAASIVALEFCVFSKPIFAAIIMFILVGEIPTIIKLFGFMIIAVSLIRFHALERQSKRERKAIGQKLFDEKTIIAVEESKKQVN